MKTYVAESDVEPNEWEFNVDTVYHNYNISQKTRDDEDKTKYYEYSVDEYTYKEYTLTTLQANSQTLDDIVFSMLGE